MNFTRDTAEVYVPDGLAAGEALARTTHMGISAHQDDLEIMAVDGILKCFQQPDKWFSGVIITDGAGSPRSGLYGSYTDEQMKAIRVQEQRKAAIVGDYGAQVQLGHPSSAVKDSANVDVVADLVTVLKAAQPEVVYTHNLADKHPTHIATAMRVLAAIRSLPAGGRPRKLYGCEVWRGLDWMMDEDKAVFDCSAQENLQEALLGVFDSQISGGKRYDLATMGRRRANATYYQSHGVDEADLLAFAMDLTPLIEDPSLDVSAFVQAHIDRFAQDVRRLLSQMA